ncbi:LuxR family transcriptional regulator [Propionibacteriaceae bacterium Y1685]
MPTTTLTAVSLAARAEEVLGMARKAERGRSASTIQGGRGHLLRQTLLALVADRSLGEHETHGEASLQVIIGSVVLTSGELVIEARAGDLISVPAARHVLSARTDAVVLLTIATPHDQPPSDTSPR